MKKWMLRILLFLLICSTGLFIGHRWYLSQSEVTPGIEIEIFKGATAKQVADLLETEGIVKKADVFYYYIRLKESYYEYIKKEPYRFQVNFKTGLFEIEGTTFDSLIAQLNKGSTKPPVNPQEPSSGYVTIPEGSSVATIAAILEKHNVIKADAFIEYSNLQTTYEDLQKTYLWLPAYNKEKPFQLEGYLHANTYDFKNQALPKDIIQTLIKPTDNWYESNKPLITDSPYTFDQILTLASVVERESKFKEDRPKVAQVFYNRLNKDMKLESDITAAYGTGEHKIFMYNKDIQKESPYNTYLIPALPVGPIASPSEESFQATLHPAGNEFKAIYFYARPSGETFYAETFDQHEKNRLTYEKEWKELEKKAQ